MSTVTVGKPAPEFSTTDEAGHAVSSASLKGKTAFALVFFPKDDTPGCTKEMCSIRDGQPKLDAAAVKVFGVSYEGKEAHEAFRAKYQLTSPILMDTEKKIGAAFGLSQGAYPDRKTFVVDKQGVLVAVIDKIDFADHGAQILAALGK